ncbi:universal stress protein [Aegicerativicinus sediminis]
MRKIVVPTDFSANAMNALKYAVELFKYDTCEIFILHVYQDEIFFEDNSRTLVETKNARKSIANRSQLKLEETLKEIQEFSPNPRHNYKIISADNLLLDEIDAIVERENIDIIVMGTRGETNDKKITFGSHTLQVLKYVRCPVLAIPENYQHIQPRRVLFTTNYLIPYKRRELKLLCEMVHPYRAQIDLLYMSKSNSLSQRQLDNQNLLKNELCKNKLTFLKVGSKDIVPTIFEYVKEHDVDLLVMVNYKHSSEQNIVFQSTIDKISLHIEIPFLVLQNITRY